MGSIGVRAAVPIGAPDLVQRYRAHTTLQIRVGIAVCPAGQAAQIASDEGAVIEGLALVAAGHLGPNELRSFVGALAGGVRQTPRSGQGRR